jgi:uroporphyrinogen-III synthase
LSENALRGKRVAILEARLGAELVDLVKKRGGQPLHAPALAELPDLDLEAIRELVESLRQRAPKLAIFQTGVGTRALFAATDQMGLTESFLQALKDAVVAVRGPKPGGALRSRGVRIDRSAADPFTTKEVIEVTSDVEIRGGRVLVQRYGTANADLDQALAARGAEVIEIPTYRWSLPQDTAPLAGLISALEQGEVDAVVFTNGEQARNLFAVARQSGKAEMLRKALNTTLVASIGPVASAALREVEVNVGLEAKPPKLGALLAALDHALA